MIFMEESSKEEEQFSEENLSLEANFCIYVTKENDDLMFSCDWTDNEYSAGYIGEILYSLKYANLIDKIYSDIQRQCVENDRMEDFLKIKSYIEARKSNTENDEFNQVVMRPRDIK